MLTAKRMRAGSDAQRLLKNGDLLLAVDGRLAARFQDVDEACEAAAEQGLASVEVTVMRDEEELKLRVQLDQLDDIGTRRVVQWSGMQLQAPHHAVQVSLPLL